MDSENPQSTPWMCRGVRGATTAEANSEEAILSTTRELLLTLIHENGIKSEDIASVWFTTTSDLTACFPAIAARQIGWFDVPLLCTHEMEVPGSLRMAVRVLINWNTQRSQKEIRHVYLRESIKLRPDKIVIPPISAEDAEKYLHSLGLNGLFEIKT